MKKRQDEMQPTTRQAKQPPANRPVLLRAVAVVLVFALAAIGLGYRLSVLQLDEAGYWEALASQQQLKNIPIEPARGYIYDANMKVLAQSATVWSVTASPDVMAQNGLKNDKKADAAAVAARELAALLGLDEAALYEKLSDKDKKYYMVKAKIDKPVADAVRAMCSEYGVSGIYLVEDTKRYYPYETLASSILGFTNADGDGIEGLESQYNELLSGKPGRTVSVVNAFGGEMPVGDSMTYPAEDGQSLVLTVEVEIQKIMEEHLNKAVAEFSVKQRAMAIAMDVNTGAILGMAVSGGYNPNDPYYVYDTAAREAYEAMPRNNEEEIALYTTAQGEARTLQWRNKALADTYEPGSVFKIITAAAALDSGVYNEGSTFYCNSSIDIADKTFSCAEGKAHGPLDLRHALIESCNCSFIEISANIGLDTWYNYLSAFGLTEPTGVDLPGEPSQRSMANLVYNKDAMGPVQLASCSFGQSNKYTALQMITAISAAVNGGYLMQPYIVDKVLDAQGNVVVQNQPSVKRQAISEETSAILRSTLEELVAETGNGQHAYIAGYRVGGKSGTSQKLELLTQENRTEYISSFVGFAPADDPQIAVLVALDEPVDPSPRQNFFGSRLAGPSVREILRDTMPILGIPATYESEEDLARTTISVPTVSGNALEVARKILNQAGLDYKTLGGGGTVVYQYPPAYQDIPYGGTVYLYTEESPPEMVQVPDLTGKTARAAIDQLKMLGLNVITTGAPDSGDGVVVTGQSLEIGSEVEKGTIITLTMSNPNARENV